jgi:hypothetical protein
MGEIVHARVLDLLTRLYVGHVEAERTPVVLARRPSLRARQQAHQHESAHRPVGHRLRQRRQTEEVKPACSEMPQPVTG